MIDPLGELREALRRGTPPESASINLPDVPSISYAVSRFFLSWSHTGRLGADEAVLLRQVLRWSMIPSLFIGSSPVFVSPFIEHLNLAGVSWSAPGQLIAHPFVAGWSTEASKCDQPPTKRCPDEGFLAEAYLESIGYKRWRSHAQKEAAWATINAPAGATRVVVLPTGAGKSLCFQLLPRFLPGLTVVVVPTVALAIDQQINAARLFADLGDVNPLFFASDDDSEATIAAVREKRTRLLFTSPESCVSGRLRPILDNFASAHSGWLTNLVVDEAHLIETWGAQFRVEFQVLSAARRVWKASSEGKLRTFLFSATMSPNCRQLLQKLFSDEEEPHEFISQRIRPEIQYFSHKFSDKTERDQAAFESVWHLSRPAILYVTEKDEATSLVTELRTRGFQRIESFHGDTGRKSRRDILRRWKENEIDLVVATSAFGVGVDKSDVRAVVHACYPENLDRYYQEVGRGGRDGWSSVSLLMTCPEDRTVAEGITVKLMSPELIQERWEAMFQKGEERETHVYALPVASRRIGLLGTRTFKENVRWNKRLLLQLERAGLLEFNGLEFRAAKASEDDSEEWAVVKLKFPPLNPHLGEDIETQRNTELAHFKKGLDKLDDFLTQTRCAARVIGQLYQIHQPGCPGCPFCRSQSRPPSDCEPLKFPVTPPYPQKFISELISEFPTLSGYDERARFIDGISRCVTSKGVRQFFCSPSRFESVLNCFEDAFPKNTAEKHRIDPMLHSACLSTSTSLPIAFLHFDTLDETALVVGRNHPSIHLLCGVTSLHDDNGRHVSVNEHMRHWPSFEAWISQPPETSLPCLPMML